jgi:putative serine protease PepD
MSTGTEPVQPPPVPFPPRPPAVHPGYQTYAAPPPSPAPQPFPGPQPTPSSPRRGPSWPGIVALALVGLLLSLAVLQAYQIHRLGTQLGRAQSALAADRADESRRLSAIEQKLAGQFDGERLAAGSLPSVFRVRAGDFQGTAFAVGKPATDGGTNLFTNFHVVEQAWDRGERKVKLEHADQLFDATIVAGDKKLDVAQLHTTAKIDGLAVAPDPAKAGQPVLVVGAPQGLKDTVTTGIVSAFRDANSDHGPYIQFDAPINPGNSGGPVINAAAQVIGIASAKFTDAEGIGLAIPIKVACEKYAVC